MKIVYVYDAIARIGGVERVLVNKMNYIAEQFGYEVYLITAAQGKHPFSFPLSHLIKHIDINARFHLQYQYKYPYRLWVKWLMNQHFKKNLKAQLDIINPDVIIGTTYYKADVICQLNCKAKKIIESHCAKNYTGISDGVKRNSFIESFHRLSLKRKESIIKKRCNALVTLTQKDALDWNIMKKTFIIPNMITAIPQENCIYSVKRVLSVGRLIYQKGFDRLIQAWQEVHKQHPDWILDIFGEGEEKEHLLRLIKAEGLSNNINIHPFTNEISKEYRNSSIYVLPSRYEGFGLVLIEAMTYGLPCISFDCPYGPSDIIHNDKDSILVPNNDIQRFSQSINRLIEHENLRMNYGRKAKTNVEQYLPSIVMQQWFNLFKNIQ